MKMFLKKRMKKAGLFVLAAMAAAALCGCGNGSKAVEYLEDMEEFSNGYHTAFIHLNQDWITVEGGDEFSLTAGNVYSGEMAKLEQAPKNMSTDITSMDDWKQAVEDAYGISDIEAADSIEVPGMTSVSVYNATFGSDEYKQDAYIVYGETDYAYYFIMYTAAEMNDEKKAAFEASCSTFRERDEVKYLKDMLEFANNDNTVFIHLNQDWGTLDAGGGHLIAGNEDLSEWAEVRQIPKNKDNEGFSADDLILATEEAYGLSDVEAADSIEVPGMTSVSVYSAVISADGGTANVYIVCGETDYAYYTIMYIADEMNDEKKAAFAASCFTFREEVQ